jgi:Tol biopolymer transport system component
LTVLRALAAAFKPLAVGGIIAGGSLGLWQFALGGLGEHDRQEPAFAASSQSEAPRIVYTQFGLQRDTIWAADPDEPANRNSLAVVDHAEGYGIFAALSPDGARVAYTVLPPDERRPSADAPAELWVMDIDGGNARLLASDVDLLITPVWSADSTSLVVRRSTSVEDAAGSFELVYVELAGRVSTLLSASAGLFPIGFTSDGASLYYAQVSSQGTDLGSVSLAGGRGELIAELSDDISRDWHLSADGTRLAYLAIRDDGTGFSARVLDLSGAASGQADGGGKPSLGTLATLNNRDEDAADEFNPIWHPNGQNLTLGRIDRAGSSPAVNLRAADGKLRALAAPQGGFDVPLSWSDDGGYLAVRSFEGSSATEAGASYVTVVGSEGSRRQLSSSSDLMVIGWLPAGTVSTQEASTSSDAAVSAAASGCAFDEPPMTYETSEDRQLYLDAMDLAAYNMLFPGDDFFSVEHLETGLRNSRGKTQPEVPATLLKAIAWIESAMIQASFDTPFEGIGPALISFDCGHGIMQVTSGMTTPLGENDRESPEQALVATHFAYNIARGAVILADKWNAAPENRPIAGTDTGGDPDIVENWYFAVWSYNGFTGPGANRSNHPLDPIYGEWPRTPYSCGPADDGLGHNRGNYPYQELVFGCASNPPRVESQPLWNPLPLSLPDLEDPLWKEPLSLSNFSFPYTSMDIPTPKPFHKDPTPKPSVNLRAQVLGNPNLVVNPSQARITVESERSAKPARVTIWNRGSGVLAWRAVASEPWLTISEPAGVAVGADMTCAADSPCERSPTIEISVDPKQAPPGTHESLVTIESLTTGQKKDIVVSVMTVIRIGVPGVARD